MLSRHALLRWLSSLLLAFALVTRVHAQAPITFQYFYDDLGQLIKVIDSAGNEVDYTYDAVGNITQITRVAAPASGTLAIINFTPQQGAVGDVVTIQGQGFSVAASANTVQFNGSAATVTSASATTLVVTVPNGATTGPISVTVDSATVQSSSNFTVIPVPVIMSLSRRSALFNTVIPNVTVTGANFTGATFSFQTSAITVTAAAIDPSGTSANVSLSVGIQAGTFALVGTNAFGSSTPGITPGNRFTVVNPNSTADSDGDGFPDVVEAFFGSDPLDPTSVPTILPVPEADSQTVSVLNGIAPPSIGSTELEVDSLTVALVNGVAPPAQPMVAEVESLPVAVLNGTAPLSQPMVIEAESLPVAVLNGTAPPMQPVMVEADSPPVALVNGAMSALNAAVKWSESSLDSLVESEKKRR